MLQERSTNDWNFIGVLHDDERLTYRTIGGEWPDVQFRTRNREIKGLSTFVHETDVDDGLDAIDL